MLDQWAQLFFQGTNVQLAIIVVQRFVLALPEDRGVCDLVRQFDVSSVEMD